MRLHHRDDIARAGLAGGLEHGRDLHRVVPVIVDDGDAADLAHPGETSLHALEAGERAADRIIGHVHLHAHGDGGQRVLHVVLAKHRQPERLESARAAGGAVLHHHLEGRAQAVGQQLLCPHIGLW